MIIPFFLMNRGCSHRCLFCNERLTAGDHPGRIEAGAFDGVVRTSLSGRRRRSGPVQIAFYGGTFTGMSLEEQSRLLDLASPFIESGEIDGIRISTRPDEIRPEGLVLLKARGVTTIEVGAQSLDDTVLLLSGRGHTSDDTVRAVTLLREEGFETGIHLMAGLPGDSPEHFAQTIDKTIALRPAMVRIHPTLVLKDTPLARAFRAGEYRPLTLDEAVDWCKAALIKLNSASIPVIRMGLQTTAELEAPGAVLAGPFHPAFGSIVESALFLEMALSLLASAGVTDGKSNKNALDFIVSSADFSSFLGPRRENLMMLQERFPHAAFHITADPAQLRRSLILTTGNRRLQTDGAGRIEESVGKVCIGSTDMLLKESDVPNASPPGRRT
jgi:histone acetyltransferase (RNA polymerase elongator complex component)